MTILGVYKYEWRWEDKYMLLLKPWYQAFNLVTESFDMIPIWLRLPNLPLQFWFESFFEAIGNFLDTRILVEMDLKNSLPEKIYLQIANGIWLQLVDYEGVTFRYTRMFLTGHVGAKCVKQRMNKQATWWRESSLQHYLVEKESVGQDEPQKVSMEMIATNDK
ncbi:hypothetical protein SUGI_1066990 [Cryptomeria japonica]|nr:hypothetical protein SUGI_1066990 [Cryptomeria japonica]